MIVISWCDLWPLPCSQRSVVSSSTPPHMPQLFGMKEVTRSSSSSALNKMSLSFPSNRHERQLCLTSRSSSSDLEPN